MTAPLAALVADLRALEAKLRPGEWQHGIAGNCNLVSYDHDDIVGVAHVPSGDALMFIAALRNASPSLMDAAERCARLEAALRHYANPDNWNIGPGSPERRRVFVEPDTKTPEGYHGYELARSALSEGDSK